MKQLTQISADSKQTVKFILDDNTQFTLYMEYHDNTSGWYFDLTYNNFSITEQRMTNHPNILRQYQNIVPFGLFISVPDGTEPLYIDDFSTGRAAVYVLTAAEVATIEATLVSTSNK